MNDTAVKKEKKQKTERGKGVIKRKWMYYRTTMKMKWQRARTLHQRNWGDHRERETEKNDLIKHFIVCSVMTMCVDLDWLFILWVLYYFRKNLRMEHRRHFKQNWSNKVMCCRQLIKGFLISQTSTEPLFPLLSLFILSSVSCHRHSAHSLCWDQSIRSRWWHCLLLHWQWSVAMLPLFLYLALSVTPLNWWWNALCPPNWWLIRYRWCIGVIRDDWSHVVWFGDRPPGGVWGFSRCMFLWKGVHSLCTQLVTWFTADLSLKLDIGQYRMLVLSLSQCSIMFLFARSYTHYIAECGHRIWMGYPNGNGL